MWFVIIVLLNEVRGLHRIPVLEIDMTIRRSVSKNGVVLALRWQQCILYERQFCGRLSVEP